MNEVSDEDWSVWAGKLRVYREDAGGDPLYALDEIKEKCRQLIQLTDGTWLCLNYEGATPEEALPLYFALFEFNSSYADDSETRVSRVFCGEGPSANLREMRHIWWGANGDGYTFYVPSKAVRLALEYLEKFFD